MEADLVIHNARIHTMNPQAPLASALAVHEGRIVFVGGDADGLETAGRTAKRLDANGRCVLPGLSDSHIHLKWYAESLHSVDAGTRPEEACRRVADRARSSKPGQWIRGGGWDHNLWAGFPSRRMLDLAAPDNPVVLQAKSGHALWVSTLALRRAGISAQSEDPAGGRILRDGASREPTGILLENAMDLVLDVIPDPEPHELAAMMEKAQEKLLGFGLAAAHDFDSIAALRALQILHSRGVLALRVVKGIPRELLDAAIAVGMTTGFGGDLLSMGALKIFSDGALGPGTAWMLEPYAGSDPLDSPIGIPTITEEELLETVFKANAAGIACAVHAIGDAACRAALNAFRKAADRLSVETRPDSPKPRNRIEHAQLLHPADLPRLASLSVVASMQPIHAVSDMLIAEKHWGARCAGAYAWKSLLASGAALAFGSDCPVETPDPLAGIHAAVTRRRRDGSPGQEGWRPEQRLSVEEAVRAYTVGAAYACGHEGDRGTLEPGKRADLTILDRDIFTIDAGEIPEARVDAVAVDGRFALRRF